MYSIKIIMNDGGTFEKPGGRNMESTMERVKEIIREGFIHKYESGMFRFYSPYHIKAIDIREDKKE